MKSCFVEYCDTLKNLENCCSGFPLSEIAHSKNKGTAVAFLHIQSEKSKGDDDMPIKSHVTSEEK